jgi:hypothetical protein
MTGSDISFEPNEKVESEGRRGKRHRNEEEAKTRNALIHFNGLNSLNVNHTT